MRSAIFIDQIPAKTVVFQKLTGKLTIFNPKQQSLFGRLSVPYPWISRVECLNFGQRGASRRSATDVVTSLVLSVTHFNPSLKISLHQLRRESNCL